MIFLKKLYYKILYYKTYKGIEKLSKGDEEHCAYNAMIFSTLFLMMNLIVLIFFLMNILNLAIGDVTLQIGTILFLFVVFILSYVKIYRSRKYRIYNKEIEGSIYRGSLGNWIIGIYIVLTFPTNILLALYFIRTHNVVRYY